MKKKSATITVRIEPELKREAEKILQMLGISTSTLITMLYKQIVSKKGIPFEAMLITGDYYDGDVKEMLKQSKKSKRYSSEQVKKELLNFGGVK